MGGQFVVGLFSGGCGRGGKEGNILVDKESEKYIWIDPDYFISQEYGYQYADIMSKDDIVKCDTDDSSDYTCKYDKALQLIDINNKKAKIATWILRNGKFSESVENMWSIYSQPVNFFATDEEFSQIGDKLKEYDIDLAEQRWLKLGKTQENNEQ